MCSVVGYIGGNKSRQIVLQGLSRLEYRGYDSAGFACYDSLAHKLRYVRSTGPLINLQKAFENKPINGCVGIGHTRWATHGLSTENNAHPQFDCHQSISVVHNGIIENHASLKKALELQGHLFCSQTDTEVIAHYFEQALHDHNDLHIAVKNLVNALEGAYAFIIVAQQYPDTLIAVRRRSPLCVGAGENEMFVASDVIAFSDKTDAVFFVPDEHWMLITRHEMRLYNFDGTTIPFVFQKINAEWKESGKQGYQHYMLKEIYEQKDAIVRTVDTLSQHSDTIWQQLGITAEQVQQLESLNLLGCGTSWHAARIAQFFFETVANVPTAVHLASEFRFMPFFRKNNSWYMTISQSGETADTLEALRLLTARKSLTATLTNVASSTIVRESHGYFLTQAGPEVAVASTKAFTTQLAALYWLAHRIALEKQIITVHDMAKAVADLRNAAVALEYAIDLNKERIMIEYAPFYSKFTKAIFLGRHTSYSFAMEAALKLKEVAYIFSQCYPAGELKHGPLALIQPDVPVFIFSHQDPIIYQKLISNVQEVKARAGHVVALAFEGQHELISLADATMIIPRTNSPLLGPLVMSGVMQFFVYAVAKHLGREIDKPRNLAKSVTVE